MTGSSLKAATLYPTVSEYVRKIPHKNIHKRIKMLNIILKDIPPKNFKIKKFKSIGHFLNF